MIHSLVRLRVHRRTMFCNVRIGQALARRGFGQYLPRLREWGRVAQLAYRVLPVMPEEL